MIVNMLILLRYAGVPLNEVVFWDKDPYGKVAEIELPAFRAKLQRSTKGSTEPPRRSFLDRLRQKVFESGKL